MDDARPGESHLVSRAPRALGISFVNTIAGRLGTLGIGIALARLLGPEEFGTYAVALLALTAALSFNELGVSLAIVRWPGDPREIAPTVATISMVASTVIAIAGYLAAPGFAAAMGAPDATGVTQVMALSVLISGTVATPAALMQRQFMQEKRMIVDQVNTWGGAIVSLLLAIGGAGAMSLAVGRVVGSTAAMVLFIRFSPEPFRLGFDRTLIRRLLRFGVPLAGASILVFAISFADQLVVGRVLGATALGYYLLAFNLCSWPVQIFSQPLRHVAPPTFARLQHEPPAMRAAFRRIAGLLAAVTFPICLVLAGAAEPVIRLLYGEVWTPAAAALLWLGVLAAFRIFFELAYDYLVVLGISRAILGVQLMTLAVLVPALIVGADEFGIAGAAAAQVIVAASVSLPLYLALLHRAHLPSLGVLARLALPVVVSAAVGAGALALSEAIGSAILALLLAGLVGLAAIAAMVYLDRDALRRLRGSALAESAAGAPVAA